MRIYARSFICALFAVICNTAHAADLPSAREELKATQSQVQQSQKRQRELTEQTGQVASELKKLQTELVTLTDNIRKNARGLLDAEQKLTILNRELSEKSAVLKERQAQLSSMIGAAIRLSQTPPEAAIMMPGEFGAAAEAARVLSTLTHSIRRESKNIGEQMEELAAIKKKVQQNRAQIDADQHSLVAEQQNLDSKLSDRKRLAEQLLREQADVKRRMGELSRQAKDLQQLLSALEASRQAEEAKEKARPKAEQVPKISGKLKAFPDSGKLIMPVDGRVTRRFGDALGKNESSKGAVIHASVGARVVAPYDGEVVFVGPFLNYGTMVILRHADDYHTLLAGLDTVSVSVGEFLLEGEPIGAMSGAPAGADLYVELRHHNAPVNPAQWISALK